MPSVRVYVPEEPTAIAGGSAVFGQPPDRARVRVDYEGDIYGRGWGFAEKLAHATDRHLAEYPTVARLWLAPEALEPVGWYDRETDELVVDDRSVAARLSEWIGAEAEGCDARLSEGQTITLAAIAAGVDVARTEQTSLEGARPEEPNRGGLA